MLGYYLTKHPDIYAELMGIIDEHIAKVDEYNKSVAGNELAARLLRPDDEVIGETAEVYAATYTDSTDEYLLAASAAQRVPVGQGVLHLGWMSQLDLGGDGILEVDLEGIKRQEVLARLAYYSDMYMYIEPQQIVFARQQDKIAWIVRNEAGIDLTGVVFPIAFLIGPRKQLLV